MHDYVELDDAELSSDLIRRLRGLERWVSPKQMGEVWIFPPLDEPEGTREFMLFTRMAGDDEREVYSARLRLDAPGKAAVGNNGGPGRNGGSADPAKENGTEGVHPSHDGVERPEVAGRPAPDQAVVEHGSAPAERMPALVERFLRRMGDDRPPVHVRIDGSRQRWDELVTRLSEEAPAEDGGQPH